MSTEPPFKQTIFTQTIKSQAELIADAAKDPDKLIRSPYGAINFAGLTDNDTQLCILIADRGAEFMQQYGVTEDRMGAACDLAVVHCNDGALDLLKFLHADSTEFAHDYSRIRRFINRQTGRLPSDCKLVHRKAQS